MNEVLIPNAQLYAARRQLVVAEMLGSGKDGIVIAAKRKAEPGRVAIKVLRCLEPFEREKQTYERLRHMKVTSILGFNVPRLVEFDNTLQVLEMTVVERPFVLDFAAAYLDARPEFPPDVWQDWETEKREQFEARWPAVLKILAAFEEMGIYLLDVSPANIAFPDDPTCPWNSPSAWLPETPNS